MDFPLPIPGDLRRTIAPGAPILLALSGGVDSALSLALLRALDCEVLAVTFKNFCYGDQDAAGAKACCSLDAIEDARELAQRFGARHWVHDVSARFQELVIDPFVAEYRAARTPSPCLDCNSSVRFPALLALADQQGCPLVATGHYARVVPGPAGEPELHRGLDPGKDQSYFLAPVPREIWRRVVFPLGWYTKEQVRAAARELRLPVAEKAESQEICFVPDGDRSFLFDGPDAGRSGPVTDRRGRVLGEHRGLEHYTVGQRRGLGIAHPEPLYVLALEPRTNTLVVGPHAELATRRLACDGFRAAVNDLPDVGPDGLEPVIARVRHRHAGVRVASWRREGERLEVELAEAVHGAAPGQGLALYHDHRVLGAGRLRVAGAPDAPGTQPVSPRAARDAEQGGA